MNPTHIEYNSYDLEENEVEAVNQLNLKNVSRILETSKGIEFVDNSYMGSLKIWFDKCFIHWINLHPKIFIRTTSNNLQFYYLEKYN